MSITYGPVKLVLERMGDKAANPVPNAAAMIWQTLLTVRYAEAEIKCIKHV